MRTWHVTTLGEPAEALTLTTITTPKPGPGEVLIRVGAVAANFPDVLLARGLYQVKPELPFAPGVECSGTVVALGEGVSRVREGDRVVAYSIGVLGEYAVVPADAVQRIPDSLDDVRAAGLTIAYQTAWFALHRRAALQPNEWLLVHAAAGGVGAAAVQLGAAAGARVIGVVGSEAKAQTARDAGAEHVILRSDDIVAEVKRITGGSGADVI
ncbi:MAG: zinc-binding dehydrogenase, partial [Leucobacter sp.]|nr:zinc-binding dehydrogenase [Leucobacter sp.]